uniref:Stabilin 2 n=1 Tax=Chelydra serpentina TaxID=8475 RepID=A0A8C3XJ35_CHESE
MKNKCAQKMLITTKTECRSCSLNLEIRCPDGYSKITNGSGIRDCRYYLEIRTYTLSLPGCRHICMKEFQQPECCQGYWGPDCMACPGGAASPCNNRGRCFQGINGDGKCTCQVYPLTYLPKTNPFLHIVCDCAHGVCNSGITGDGGCACLSGYKGLNCDQAIPECEALQCPENARCSISSEDETKLECTCLPNYHGNGKQCEPINPCLKKVCDPNAYCTYLGPNRHKCVCQEGYRGDGQVCLPIDPCQGMFGNCPTVSTICRYDGPGKSHCECKEHYRNFVPGKGCSMTDICETNSTCHKNAKCTMVAPGQIVCTCQKGYVGDGFVCYGNIMERIRDLNTEPGGQWQGKLTSAIALIENVYEWPLSSLGPFTVLLPTNKGFKGINIKDLLSNKENAQYFVKLHIITGQLNTNSLNNTDTIYTLTGKPGEILKGDKDNQLKIRIQGSKKKGKILQGDIIASNGILHIIDKAMDNVEPTFGSSKEETIMTVIQDNRRYSRFRSMLEKTILGLVLEQDGGPYTIFVPNNNALDNMKDGALDYLLSTELKTPTTPSFVYFNHFYSLQLEVASLISIEHVKTMARQFIYFNATSNGQILVNGEETEETDIVAKNGRIYTLAGVLIPPSIVPILPHRCDGGRSEIKMGTCVKCSVFYRSTCPEDSKPIVIFRWRKKVLLSMPCRSMCFTSQEPKCCKGFYGPDCNQCPGGFSKPCSGNGQCVDGMKGNGTCICTDGFQGSRCQFCSDPDKYGPQCDKKCLCVYGKCDNRIESDGICLAGSCKSGYAGKLCDKQIVPCGPFVQFCHAHANCQLSNAGPASAPPNQECIKTGLGTHTCVCQPGWSGNGRDCSEINNCLLPNFRGCHDNATCIYVGPGQNDCECKEGFRGNGIECEPINSCLEQNGKCHHLATCQFVSSGVWDCVCPKGYEGGGIICYGSAADELSALSEAAGFNQWVNEASVNTMLSVTSNLTVLVPSLRAIENMDQDEKAFWMLKNNIATLLKYHVLVGAYRLADLQNLSSSDMLATSLHNNFLHLSKENEVRSLVNYCTHGICQCIDIVCIGLSGTLPKLLARLEQMPDYSIFRGYVIQYSLANEIEAANTYTVFAPNNDAIESYLRNKKSATLDEDQIRYHIVLEEKLLKNDMHNGMHRETMLGFSYQVGFFLHNDQVLLSAFKCINMHHGITKNNHNKDTVEQRCVMISNIPPSSFLHSSCLLKSGGTAYCKCAAGFKGNGTHCTVIDACETSNGGCSVKAECRRTTPGNRVCVCTAGYTGDGIVCLEINPCLENNGGCDRNAECTQTGPNQAACNCLKGYSGDGKICTYINLCLSNNGGCSESAICNDTELTERTCTCKPDYVGDGFKCRGNIYQELLKDSNTTHFYFHLKALALKDVAGSGPFTVFAPNTEAFNSEPKIKDWIVNGVMPQILRYHMVGCAGLLYNDLTTITNVTSLQGDPIQVTFSQNSVYLNTKAKIIFSDTVSTNGVIHIIDKILLPQHMQEFPKGESGIERVQKKPLVFSMLQNAGLMSVINDPLHKPVTLFWPTDEALRALPKEQQDFLFKKSNKDKLVQYLKFHVIRDAKILAFELPSSNSLKTLQGSDLSVKCGDNNNSIGDLFLNDRRCRIVQRHLEFDGGIAYGIDCMLMDPTLGGRCDNFITADFPVKHSITHKCTYQFYGRSLDGCRQDCSMVVWIAKCCQGYYGRDCQACPGGPETPCNNHGLCNDGYSGTGECKCNNGFNGTSCELCLPGRYGSDCKPCNCKASGQCDEGTSGSGQCFCETGWTGRFCETKLALPPVCSPNCSSNAICKENNMCQCKPFYEGDGITCTAVNLCKQNNGGCHQNSKCTQTGVKVLCSCQKGYTGDGRTCLPINPCADGLNGGCHEHAICTMTGPDKRKCECKNNYVGDGLDCTVMQLPVDRCLQDNGQCHADANCADLHFQDATVGVFHLRSPQGQYKLTYEKAKEACASEGATIATYNQLSYAQKAQYHFCAAGWLDSERVGYPTAFSSPNCGSGFVGIVDYGPRVNLTETWDVFCYRVKDVNCTCKIGYVGNGFTCSGNLLQVLMSFPMFTNFLSEVLVYSNSSMKGRQFLKYLTNLSTRATLFAPNNNGLRENETLSGRDIEYHLSNSSTLFYEDLTNGTTLQTRIEKRLLITYSIGQDDQIPTKKKTRYVDGKSILEWDIIASNGVIHVISEPLKAPPPPASLHAGFGTGIFFAIILVIGIVAFVVYSYFRFKRGNIGFQYFKGEIVSPATRSYFSSSPRCSASGSH